MTDNKVKAVFLAILAAVLYAMNTPFSKLLIEYIPATYMAGFLYLGAGIGIGIMYLFKIHKEPKELRLNRQDLPYTIGMIVLDIAAPIFLMLGIKFGSASDASLLGNFEIAATTFIALLFFRENVSKTLWTAIGFITVASILLSVNAGDGFSFSFGSLMVLLATMCWGLENNCTRSISEKSTYQIVTLKGLCSGTGSCLIALATGEKLPGGIYIVMAMLLGFAAYGLSIFTYIRAQSQLGAAKTSAYYAVAPFIGAALSFLLLKDPLTEKYALALVIMLIGTVLVVKDTLVRSHSHKHIHVITHTHDGSTHTHTIEHEHRHHHIGEADTHTHHSDKEYENSAAHKAQHLHHSF